MFWLIFTIALWGTVHSFLASMMFKNFFRHALGGTFMKVYRLLYNIFAVISIAPVIYLMVSLPEKPLYQVPVPWNYVLLAGQAYADYKSQTPMLIPALSRPVAQRGNSAGTNDFDGSS